MKAESAGTAVSRDMERVFSRLPGAGRTGTAVQPRPAPQSWWARRAGTRAALLLLAAATLIGLMAFILLKTARPPTHAPLPTLAPEEGVRPAPVSASTVAARASTRIAPASALMPAPTAKHASTSKPPPSPAIVARAATRPAAVRAHPAAVLAPGRRAAGGKRAPAPARAASASGRDARADASRAASAAVPPCRDAADHGACFFLKVQDADRILRDAYAQASRSAMPVAELLKVRRAWKSALSRSRKEPLASIGTIEALTASLNQAGSAGTRPE